MDICVESLSCDPGGDAVRGDRAARARRVRRAAHRAAAAGRPLPHLLGAAAPRGPAQGETPTHIHTERDAHTHIFTIL